VKPPTPRCAAQRGQAVVEMALVLPLLLVLALGIVDFGRVYASYVALAGAAGEAARYCARHPGDTTGTRARLTGALGGRGSPNVLETSCAAAAAGEAVTVDVVMTFNPVTPYITQIVGGPLRVALSATEIAR
jgi:Flp pilus assembly protein TadG